MAQSVIDHAIFTNLQATAGAEFVTELVDTFLEEAPQILAELRGARADADADRFRRAAHSLKSNSLTFGAMALGAIARDIELRGLAADAAVHGAALDALNALDAAYAQAAAALKELCSG